jgi:hypothetical protein
MDYLLKEGFCVGRCGVGFVAVDKDGLVFLISPHRCHASIQNKLHGKFRETKIRGYPTNEQLSQIIDSFIPWSKGTKPAP